MSELTPCNFCSLRRIKTRAKKKGDLVTTTPSTDMTPAGMDVLVYPKHLTAKDARANRKTYKVAWLMKLTDKCCC